MNAKIKIVCDNKIPFLQEVLEPFADVRYLPPAEINRDSVKDADALLIRTRTKCNAQLLDGSSVKFIGTATIGFDHIDTKYCEFKNIKWANAPGCNSSSVMQYLASALVTLAKKRNLELNKLTIGIVGVGNVGSKVAKMSELLGLNVLMNDPPRMRAEGKSGFVELDKLVSESDVITFHVPLIREEIDKTFHLADEHFFAKFNGKKILINTSRGEVVDTSALKNAIQKGTVNACVLDVWENEPGIDCKLLQMVDIATPHIAGYSADGKANGTSVCVRAVSSFFDLGIQPDWYPAELPKPESPEKFLIDCKSKSTQEILTEVILNTYKILDDDKILRNSVETFEKQRGHYPVRREFPYYSIETRNCEPAVFDALAKLGFRTERNE